MAKKVKSSRLLFITISLLVVFVAAYFFTQQTFYGDEVWIPEFGRLKCEAEPVVRSLGAVSWDGQSYVCGQDTYAANGCNYDIKITAATTGVVKDCALNSDDCITKQSWSASQITREEQFYIPYGRRLYVNPDKFISFGFSGQWEIVEQSDAYRLRQIDHGFETVGLDCKLTHLQGFVQLEKDKLGYRVVRDKNNDMTLAPGEIVNYVSSRSSVVTANAVKISGINNGNPIYVLAPQQYALIIKGDDGKNYVDMSSIKFDQKIECTPASPYCDDDAKERVNPIGDNCNLGIAPGYVAVDEKTNCKVECVNGLVVSTKDCKDRLDSCPSGRPLYNPQSGECETLSPPIILDNSNLAKYIPWIVGGIFGIVLLLVILKVGSSNNQMPPARRVR